MRGVNLPSWWRGVFLIATILLTPLILLIDNTQASRCGLVMLVMGILWVTEVLPLVATALMPVFAFPLLGILSTGAVCRLYLKDSNMLFLGGLMMATALQHSNLHERIALYIILHLGQSPRLLSLGLMLASSFLSLWISSTATATLIAPVVSAVVKELTQLRELEVMKELQSHADRDGMAKEEEEEEEGGEVATPRYLQPSPDGTYIDMHVIKEETMNGHQEDQLEVSHAVMNEEDLVVEIRSKKCVVKTSKMEAVTEECRSLKQMLFLSVAFSANIGGTGSPLGAVHNLVLLEILESSFKSSLGLNFDTWLLYHVPCVVLCVLLGWAWLQILFMYCGKHRVKESNLRRESVLKHLLEGQYRALGPVSRREAVVALSFCALIMLWVFRDPGFLHGWATYFQMPDEKTTVQAATPVTLMVFLLFCIPASSKPAEGFEKPERCLIWETVHKNMPWGVVLLLGGGLALAEGMQRSGLSSVIGQQILEVVDLPKEAVVVVVCLFVSVMTEITSNTATASILLPIVANMSVGVKVHPLYLLLPATASCSFAFMLPVATPTNAVLYAASGMKTWEMMRAGVVMNVVCVVVSVFLLHTLGYAVFDLCNPLPPLANHGGQS